MAYEIPTINLPILAERIEELNRRCRKLNQPEIVFNILGEQTVEHRDDITGVKYKVRISQVEIEGNSPKIDGWQLAATVEPLPTGENLVRCVPGLTVPESYRTTDMHCDHCQTDRNRKEVFVLVHDDGRYCQVGRTCIADFLGHVSVDSLIARAEWLMKLTDTESNEWGDEFRSGRGEITRNTEHFVQTVTICIRRLGWLSRSVARKWGREHEATANIAWQLLTLNNQATKEFAARYELTVEERDEALAAKALEWARGLAGDNDYIHNLGAACRCEYVTHKTIGIVASVIAAYNKHVEKLQEFEREAKKVRGHVGVVGERQEFVGLVVKKLLYVEGNYGTKTLCRFEDADNNVLVWWASSNTDWLTEGETVDVTATVKKHGDYKGTPQTELQRVAKGLPAAKQPRKAKKTKPATETKEPIPF